MQNIILPCDRLPRKVILEGVSFVCQFETIFHFLCPNISDFSFRNYNVMVTNAPGAQHVAERSVEIKPVVLNTMTLSRSL